MSDRGWPSPRQWVGRSAFPWPAAAGLGPGDRVVACYTVLDTSLSREPAGETRLELDLADANGKVAGSLHGGADADWIRTGLYVGVRGIMEAGEGQLRIRIEDITPLRVGLDDLALFLPATPADPATLERQLAELVGSIADPGLHQLVARLLGPDEEVGRGFRMAPAATRNHHAYLGGLFEHTVSVALLCDRLAAHYGDAIDRDLLLAAALLHDIGKIREIGARAGFPYTDEGRLLGHIVLGLQMVGEAARDLPLDAGRRLLLEHLIASHQGRYEWQSPREPCVLEAIVLHYVDDLDAKANHAIGLLDGVDAGWTGYDRALGRELLRHRSPAVTAAPAPATVGKPAGRARKNRSGSGKRARAATPPRRPAKAGREPADSPAGGRAAHGKKKRTTASRRSTGEPQGGPQPERDAPSTRPPPGPAPTGFVDVDTLDLFED